MKHIIKCLFLTSLIVGLMTLEAVANEVRFIEITDASSNQQLTLVSDEKLNRFYYYWSQKRPLQSTKTQAYQWRYQLLIQDKNELSRWVYDPRGYAREVTINKSSLIYQFSSVRSFNRFLVQLKHP